MIKIRNALAAGVMGASALIVPVTMSARSAGADTVVRTVSAPPALTSLRKPCGSHKNPAKCRARHGAKHGIHGGIDSIDGGISDNRVPGGSGGGSGIDN